MHLYRLDDNTVINLEMLITLVWGKNPLPEKRPLQLQIKLNAPGELGPITYYIEGKQAHQLWQHVLEQIT